MNIGTPLLSTTTIDGNVQLGTPLNSTITISASTATINALLINLNGIVSTPSGLNTSGFYNSK